MKIQAYAAEETGGAVKPFEYEAEPKQDEIVVRVTHCGMKARVQVMPMSECNEAIEITRSGKARYRVVLER